MREPSEHDLKQAMQYGMFMHAFVQWSKTILACIGILTVLAALAVFGAAWEKKHDAEVLSKARTSAAKVAGRQARAQRQSAPVEEQ